MIDMVFVLTIFIVTLGPIKVIPGFHNFTKDLAPSETRMLALKGASIATVISLVIAAVVPGIASSWQVTPDDLRIAGGILLFASAYSMFNPDPPSNEPHEPPRRPALSPIAIPIIITPWGAAAIMIAMGLTANNAELMTTVVSNLLFVMVLNLPAMLFARYILRLTGVAFWKVLGWVFGVLQAGLAVHIIIVALGNYGFLAQP